MEQNGNSETDKIVNLLYSMSFLSADIFKIYGWSFGISPTKNSIELKWSFSIEPPNSQD